MGDKEDAGVDELAALAAALQLSSATTSSPTPQSRPRRSPAGPISYDDLKTVEGETHATFKGAALVMGLLDSDEDNHRCLTEAAQFQMLTQLRHLFAVLLVYCDPTSPDDLWNAHLPAPCEDFLRDEIEIHNLQTRAENRISEVIMDAASLDTNSRVYRRAIYLTLHDVKSNLVSNGQTLHTYFESLPQFSDYSDVETAVDVDDRNRNRLIENETSYESTTLDHQAAALNSLNADQKRVYDKVMEAVHPAGPDASVLVFPGKQFFLDGPGGTGKSFLLETILASIRREGRIALAVAGSGIAAQLLTGGRTAHSTIRLPLDPDETSTCNFGVL
ncbi:hypothetical protein PC128_g13659 [Phytophthora cactorum]|nr:hypothetical protein PC128_g13659 [Phytophthora cactorum]